ncbi:probable tubulin beta chain CG32396 [Drosophila miranda]|uniref:probable tubulin beta chain CG32396 n=1 Tax=Drosophila miranda TaxID=7229 RepID=UPI00143F9858|nr:probable tubulin beta chain CG32396 [Drosophila miranda]
MEKDGRAQKPPKKKAATILSGIEEVPAPEAAPNQTTAGGRARGTCPCPPASGGTIAALVSGLHHSGARGFQSLHQPLLECEERALAIKQHLRGHRGHGIEASPHDSMPRFIVDIEEEPSESSQSIGGQEHHYQEHPEQEHSGGGGGAGGGGAGASSSRRFSHFNLALRRFSHIHVHVNVGGKKFH